MLRCCFYEHNRNDHKHPLHLHCYLNTRALGNHLQQEREERHFNWKKHFLKATLKKQIIAIIFFSFAPFFSIHHVESHHCLLPVPNRVRIHRNPCSRCGDYQCHSVWNSITQLCLMVRWSCDVCVWVSVCVGRGRGRGVEGVVCCAVLCCVCGRCVCGVVCVCVWFFFICTFSPSKGYCVGFVWVKKGSHDGKKEAKKSTKNVIKEDLIFSLHSFFSSCTP